MKLMSLREFPYDILYCVNLFVVGYYIIVRGVRKRTYRKRFGNKGQTPDDGDCVTDITFNPIYFCVVFDEP